MVLSLSDVVLSTQADVQACICSPAIDSNDIICGDRTQIHPSSFIHMTNRPLRVFLCHSSADKPAVRALYQKLRAVPQGDDKPWIEPWLDEEEPFPGMDWNMEFEKSIEATDAVLVCPSNTSSTRSKECLYVAL